MRLVEISWGFRQFADKWCVGWVQETEINPRMNIGLQKHQKNTGLKLAINCNHTGIENIRNLLIEPLGTTQKKHRKQRRERLKGILQKVGPHVRNSPKFAWRNFIGILKVQSYVPKGSIENFPIEFISYKIPSIFFCSRRA